MATIHFMGHIFMCPFFHFHNNYSNHNPQNGKGDNSRGTSTPIIIVIGEEVAVVIIVLG